MRRSQHPRIALLAVALALCVAACSDTPQDPPVAMSGATATVVATSTSTSTSTSTDTGAAAVAPAATSSPPERAEPQITRPPAPRVTLANVRGFTPAQVRAAAGQAATVAWDTRGNQANLHKTNKPG